MSNSNKKYTPKTFYDIQRANVNFRDSTRCAHAIGITPSLVNTIDLINTISSSASTDFGDLSTTRQATTNNTSNTIRGLYMGGYAPGANNTIDFVTIITTGNTVNFGDLSQSV